MTTSLELRVAPAVAGMTACLERFQPWLESVLGSALSEVVILEIDLPVGELAAEELLAGVPLDRQCLRGAERLRPLVVRWALPPGVTPRIELAPSRVRHALVTARELAWDPHWTDTPVALWLRGLEHPVASVRIPYVSYRRGLQDAVRDWLLVRRDAVPATLALLRRLCEEPRKTVTVIGGTPLALPEGAHDWEAVVLEPALIRLLRDDFEGFLQREAWFRRHRLPFRRGYLLHGPPGNGKTSIVRVMASHPAITAYTLNFSSECLDNGDLSGLFESAGRTAPSLIVFEDLDRLYGTGGGSADNRTRITLQHLLNCLDGLGSHDGVIVVATANDPTVLDPAILRRPGRFDRTLACRPPDAALRAEFLRRLSVDPLVDDLVGQFAGQTDGLSYAQLREAFILAGQLAFQRDSVGIDGADLLEAARVVRRESQAVGRRVEARALGFDRTGGRAGATACEATGLPAEVPF